MIKRTINYVDYNGVEKTEDFYFHITSRDADMIQGSVEGGFVNKMQQYLEEGKAFALLTAFETLILKAYGKKTPDGRFVKNDEIAIEFTQTAAYEKFYKETFSSEENLVGFFNELFSTEGEAK